jgi:hypothetical protein
VYLAMILGLMVVVPVGSILFEFAASGGHADLLLLAGKWFTFWGVGVRLFTAGVSQVLRPGFTANAILSGRADASASQVVQELGFANVAFGLLGVLSLPISGWLVPAALAGGVFLGLAGVRHIAKPRKNTKELLATLTDLLVAVVLVAFVFYAWLA